MGGCRDLQLPGGVVSPYPGGKPFSEAVWQSLSRSPRRPYREQCLPGMEAGRPSRRLALAQPREDGGSAGVEAPTQEGSRMQGPLAGGVRGRADQASLQVCGPADHSAPWVGPSSHIPPLRSGRGRENRVQRG